VSPTNGSIYGWIAVAVTVAIQATWLFWWGLTFDVRGGPLAGRPLDGGVRPRSRDTRDADDDALHFEVYLDQPSALAAKTATPMSATARKARNTLRLTRPIVVAGGGTGRVAAVLDARALT
jgi:hypothetical protein